VSFSPYAARDGYELLLDDWYSTGIGATLLAMGNADLAWDKGNTLNVGVDLTLWRRYTLSASWYDKRTKNMVTDITIPSSSGFTSYTENMGEVSNRGLEISARAVIFREKDWDVNLMVNGAHNVNKILKISDALREYNDRVDLYYADYTENNRYTSNRKYIKPVRKYVEGGSETAIFGMKSLGIAPADGAEVFMNRDGSITYDWDPAEQVIIGNTEPFMQGSFALNARWKEFTLYTTFMYEFGGDLYNSTLAEMVESVDILTSNVDRRVSLMRWKEPGDIAPLKSIKDRYMVTRPTSRFVQKNNTLKFNSLSLGYDVNRGTLAKIGLSACRLQLSMNDVAIFSTIKQERGTSYPFARSFNFTLNASF
jgi:hypothetical protein